MRALEHEQRLAARERETLEAAEARMRQREDALKQREETFRKRLNEELDAQVRQARARNRRRDRRAEGEERRRSQHAPRLVSTGDDRHGAQRRARRGRRSRASACSSRQRDSSPAPDASRHRHRRAAYRVGDRVIVGGLGLEAVVTAVHDGTADLDVRGKRMRAQRARSAVVGGAGRRQRRRSTSTSICSRATRRRPI